MVPWAPRAARSMHSTLPTLILAPNPTLTLKLTLNLTLTLTLNLTLTLTPSELDGNFLCARPPSTRGRCVCGKGALGARGGAIGGARTGPARDGAAEGERRGRAAPGGRWSAGRRRGVAAVVPCGAARCGLDRPRGSGEESGECGAGCSTPRAVGSGVPL